MKRVGAGVAVVVGTLSLVTPPAVAQNTASNLTVSFAEPSESAGEVVLTVSLERAGRVMYRTMDGACSVNYSGESPDAVCYEEKARAPEDYTATSGEVVFTGDESKTITVPIVDDDVVEGDEWFTVAAWEEVDADGWISPATGQPSGDRGATSMVRIGDDESGNTAGVVPSGSVGGAPAPTTASGAGLTVHPATPKTATRPSRNLQVAPDGELRPGPGFELASAGFPESASKRADGGGGSASGLVFGLGIAALSVGALALVWRRRRWSPTRA